MINFLLYLVGNWWLLKANADSTKELLNYVQLISTADPVCSTSRNCSQVCLLGYVKDGDGCPICEQCVTRGLFEDDIIIDDETSYEQLVQYYGASRHRRAALKNSENEWPKRGKFVRVPYVIDRTIRPNIRKSIKEAVKIFKNKTCIKFVRRRSQRTYIKIHDVTYPATNIQYCAAKVGKRIGEGSQSIQLSSSCSGRSVLHELMHSLGFYHEHSRPDRDRHVTINYTNIQTGKANNFVKITRERWNSYDSPYDFESIMHYVLYAFGNGNGPTITEKNTSNYKYLRNLSKEDIHQINRKYNCASSYSTARPPTVRGIRTTTRPSRPITQRPDTTVRPNRTTSTRRPIIRYTRPCLDRRYCATAVKIGGCESNFIFYDVMLRDCRKSCKFC